MNLEIDKVISSLREKITALSQDKLNEIKTSISNELHSKDTNLKYRTTKVWNEIVMNSLDFDRKDKLLEEIVVISKKDLIDSYDNIFIDKPKKLSIQIYSGNSQLDNSTEELYYLNSNIVVKVSSDVNILNS